MTKKRVIGKPLLYNVDKRVLEIFRKTWQYGSVNKAAKHIKSKHTGKPMTQVGVRKYLESHGFKIVLAPHLITLDGNVIEI